MSYSNSFYSSAYHFRLHQPEQKRRTIDSLHIDERYAQFIAFLLCSFILSSDLGQLTAFSNNSIEHNSFHNNCSDVLYQPAIHFWEIQSIRQCDIDNSFFKNIVVSSTYQHHFGIHSIQKNISTYFVQLVIESKHTDYADLFVVSLCNARWLDPFCIDISRSLFHSEFYLEPQLLLSVPISAGYPMPVHPDLCITIITTSIPDNQQQQPQLVDLQHNSWFIWTLLVHLRNILLLQVPLDFQIHDQPVVLLVHAGHFVLRVLCVGSSGHLRGP